jgi:DNA-binding response OmpR family regulator
MTSQPDRGLIVVAEDEAPIADIIRRHLERAGYVVHHESDGLAAESAIRERQPVAVVLDIGLPGRDGIEVCRRLRGEDNWVPVLFLSARDDEVDRIVGIELGADDYLTKPFSPRELVARIGGVLRRSQQSAPTTTMLSAGNLRLDEKSRRSYLGDTELALTATEFDLLAFLMRHPGQVFSRAQLLDRVWGYGEDVTSRTVDVYIAQLRAKLGDARLLRTVRGVGYSIEKDPQ